MKYKAFLVLFVVTVMSCDDFIFPESPIESEQRIYDTWQRLFEDAFEVTIPTPSLGVDVSMTGFILDQFVILDVYKRPVLAFRGIEYANSTRFQIPNAIDEYPNGTVINAKMFCHACPQSDEKNLLEKEECLYLNIYTPYHPANVTEPLPVIVFIHGGSFTMGTGAYYLPMMYLRHDVIFVTINYRLSALGFFTINTDEAPGNYALYDQREALRWVRDHISDFGGDNELITVVGESAGAVSASYMTIIADNGVGHAEELKYLVTPLPYMNETANMVSWRMTTMWTNFATYGDPTPDSDTRWQELGIPKYTPYMLGDHHYMLLRSDFIMQTEFPLRWTIRYEEKLAGEPVTMEPPNPSYLLDQEQEEDYFENWLVNLRKKLSEILWGNPSRATEEDVKNMEDRRDAYMITMIVFIVAFVIVAGVAVYYYVLSKRCSSLYSSQAADKRDSVSLGNDRVR